MKNNIFKKFVFIFVIALVAFIPLAFVGCEQIETGSQQVSVTLNQNYANTSATSRMVDKNTTIAELSIYYNVAREGYTLKGWSEAPNGELLASDVKISSSRTLYAVWDINTYTLSYDLNGATGSIPTQTATYNSVLSVYEGASLERENYTFGGWYENKNGTGTKVGSTIVLSSNKTLYAKWIGVDVEYTTYIYDFDSKNYVQSNTFTTEYGKQITFGIDAKSHYDFLGWDEIAITTTPEELSDEFVAQFPVGERVNVNWTENQTLIIFQIWRIKTYTLSYVDTTGSEIKVDSVKYGAKNADNSFIRFEAPAAISKTGYNFESWKAQDGSTVQAGASLEVGKNYKLTPVFKAKKVEVSLIYHGTEDDITIEGKQIFTIDSKYDAVLDLSEYIGKVDSDKFIFHGWYLGLGEDSAVESVTLNNANFGNSFSENLKLNIYSKVSYQKNKVSFIAEDTETDYKSFEITYGTKFDYNALSDSEKAVINSSSVITKTGYTFVGFTDQFGNLYVPAEGFAIFNVTQDFVLTATFEVNSYKITYKLNDSMILVGSYESEFNTIVDFVKKDEVETKVTGLSRVFAGWSLTKDGSIIDPTFKMPAENISVFAQWTIFEYEMYTANEITSVKITGVFAGVADADKETLTIPTKLNGYLVTKIENNAFKDNSTVKKVILQQGLKIIGDSAFENSSIQEIVLNSDLTNIGNFAFKNSSLQTVSNVGDTNSAAFALEKLVSTNLGNEVFAGIARTTSISFPDNWKEKFENLYDSIAENDTIGVGLFKASKIEAVSFHGSKITCLSESIFEDCENLTTVIFHNSGTVASSNFKHFAKNAFKNAPVGIARKDGTGVELILPISLEYIDEGAFAGNQRMTSVRIEKNIIRIGKGAFENNSKLVQVGWGTPVASGDSDLDYEYKVNEIGESAFANTSITYIYITSTVKTIRTNAFANIGAVQTIEFEDTHTRTIETGAFANCGNTNGLDGGVVTLIMKPEGWDSKVYTGTSIIE